MFVSQLISRKQNPQQAEMQGGKFMLYFFPIFSIYICITSNTIFALYWTISNIVSLLLSTTLTRLFKKRAERQLQELKQNA
jgi:membrane protein insertase Oxa1/YidC/SpoIIIJ